MESKSSVSTICSINENEEQNTEQSTTTQPSQSSINSPQPPVKKQRVGPIKKQNDLLELACKYLSESPTDSNNDVPNIAKVWGAKLLELEREQRLFAEKSINDILFEASLGYLHRYSVQINTDIDQNGTSSTPSSHEVQSFGSFSAVEYNNELDEQNSTATSTYTLSTESNSPLPPIIRIEDKNIKNLFSNFTEN